LSIFVLELYILIDGKIEVRLFLYSGVESFWWADAIGKIFGCNNLFQLFDVTSRNICFSNRSIIRLKFIWRIQQEFEIDVDMFMKGV